MPSSLKGALVRETARRKASLNDVAVGLLADYFDVSFTPSGRKSPLPEASPVVLLRVPLDLKDEIEDEASARREERKRRHPRRASRRARAHIDTGQKGNNGFHERIEERPAEIGQQGARRHRRRRQLRQLAPPGRGVLQGRRPGRVRPRPHARRPRRLSRPRHRVLGGLRRDRGQGRQGPLRRDLGRAERHDQVRRRARRRASPSRAA